MAVPLEKRLRKRLHAEIGMLQDELVDVVYALDAKAVLHGGTAVWRCYGGNRFSEDLDFYVSKPKSVREKLAGKMDQRGLQLLKFKETKNLFFAKVSDGRIEVRLELNFSRKRSGVAMAFERIDGSFTHVLTLSAGQLALEKAEAYQARRFARDLYDVFFLARQVEKPQTISAEVQKLLERAGRPVDEKNLKAIVFSGAIPTFEQMVQGIRRVFR
jgi:predicted nucleotidyltransferase component of viral defense system